MRLAQDPSSENLGTTVWDASIGAAGSGGASLAGSFAAAAAVLAPRHH